MLSLCALVLLGPSLQEIEWSPFTLKAGDQSTEAELGRLDVPENTDKPQGPKIKLAFVRLKATGPNPGPPTVYLDGGPGGSGIGLGSSPSYFATFQKLREVGDIILLDQRGVGRTRPALTRFGGEPITPNIFESKENLYNLFRKRAVAAAAYFKGQGIDLSSYNTAQSADDVDALRTALGVPKLNIIGFSYGTHLGLSILRRHGGHLNRAVLIGTEGPDMTNKLPLEVDRQFDRLQKLIDSDPQWKDKLPNLKQVVRGTIARLEKEPLKVNYKGADGKSIEYTIGAFGFKHLILRDLGDASDFYMFPRLFYGLDHGDPSLLAALANKRYGQYSLGVNLMTFLMDGASGTSTDRAAQIAKEAKVALFGDDMNLDLGEVTLIGGKMLGDDFRGPILTDVPTLFISGMLDWNTQPYQADDVRKTFKTSEHIVVENAGHESMFDHPLIAEQIAKFLAGGTTRGFKLRLDPPKFLPPQSVASQPR